MTFERQDMCESWSSHAFVLALGEQALKGYAACIDLATGLVVAGKSATGLLPLGTFQENLVGDGVMKVEVRLYKEVLGQWFVNDQIAPVTASDVGHPCFLVDGQRVSMDGTGRSTAGRVLVVAGAQVFIDPGIAMSGPSDADTDVAAIAAAQATADAALALTTIAPLDFYFDAAGGAPGNTGLSTAQAFKDIPDLLASGRLPTIIKHTVTLHFKASGVVGVPAVYNFPVFYQLFLDANFVFEADEAWDPTCFETVATLTTEAGTTASVLNVAGLTADLYNGDWVQFTSGPASGSTPAKRCMIRENTTGALNLEHQIIGGTGVGNAFKVKRSTGVRFNMPSDVLALMVMRCTMGAGVSTLSEGSAPIVPAVCFVGIELYVAGGLFPDIVFSGGVYQFYGCRKNAEAGNGWALSFAACAFGIGSGPGAPDGLNSPLSLAPFSFSDGRWIGWGIQQTDNDTWAVVQAIAGAFGTAFVYAKTSQIMAYNFDDQLPPSVTVLGRISDGSYGTNPITAQSAKVFLGSTTCAQTVIKATGALPAMYLSRKSSLTGVNALIGSVNGAQLVVTGGSSATLQSSVTGTPTGTGKSVQCLDPGSHVFLIGPPGLGGAYSVGDGADVLAAALSAEGTAKINQYNGAVIQRSGPGGDCLLSADGSLSGTYSPTAVLVANLDSATLSGCRFSRSGKIVTVSGKATLDPTAPATSTQLGIPLPIASNLASDADLAGVAFATGVAGQGGGIFGDAANDRAQLQFVSGDITSQVMCFMFQYTIL